MFILRAEDELTELFEYFRTNEYRIHHVAWRRGYVSRKLYGIVSVYVGKFGEGYVLDMPNWNSTRYSTRMYIVEE